MTYPKGYKPPIKPSESKGEIPPIKPSESKGEIPPIKPGQLWTVLSTAISVAISVMAWHSEHFPETRVLIIIIIFLINVPIYAYIIWKRLKKRKK